MEIELHQLDRPYEGLRIRDPKQSARWLVVLSSGESSVALAAVLVVPAKTPNRFILIDGYDRISALEQLGRDTTPAIVLSMPSCEALVFAHQRGSEGRRTALEEGWLLQQVQQETGLTLTALARRFGRSLSWVSRRLGLVETLPESVQQQVRRGTIASRAALRSLLPLARANEAQCCELVSGIAGAEISAAAIERLYMAWREGDESQRARITAHPLLFLRANQEAQRSLDPAHTGSSAAVEATLKDIDVVGAICRRLRRRFVRGISPSAEAKATWLCAWHETRLAFEALVTQLERLERGAEDAR